MQWWNMFRSLTNSFYRHPGLPVNTSRLLLRDFVAADHASVHRNAVDPKVTQYTERGPNREADTKVFLAHALAAQRRRPRKQFDLAVVLKQDGYLLGACGLHVVGSPVLGERVCDRDREGPPDVGIPRVGASPDYCLLLSRECGLDPLPGESRHATRRPSTPAYVETRPVAGHVSLRHPRPRMAACWSLIHKLEEQQGEFPLAYRACAGPEYGRSDCADMHRIPPV